MNWIVLEADPYPRHSRNNFNQSKMRFYSLVQLCAEKPKGKLDVFRANDFFLLFPRNKKQ